jgi:hypothetical protein
MVQPRMIDGQRGQRYGEVLAVFARHDTLEAEVYGTQMLNDCPAELWDTLDGPTIAQEMGALFVKLNGPREWVLDGLGGKQDPVEPVLRDFNGLVMRRIAVLRLGDNPAATPYTERRVDRRVLFYWDAGKPVFELIAANGTVYVMQALCQGVDATMSHDSLATLGERLALPEGWSYRTRILDEELVVDTTGQDAIVLQDEFENSYTVPF